MRATRSSPGRTISVYRERRVSEATRKVVCGTYDGVLNLNATVELEKVVLGGAIVDEKLDGTVNREVSFGGLTGIGELTQHSGS
jgi:hypothetical protein